jgi:hypothetical protein
MYVDAGFAGDLGDSKSTGGAFIYLVGPKTCVPISWTCKKQGAVSHSSTEAEIISLDMGLRMQGTPTLELWDEIISVMTRIERKPVVRTPTLNGMYDICANIDFVPTTLPGPSGLGELVVLEDNDAVIKMIMKGRTNRMRHVPRTHRIDLDWLFDVMREDSGLKLKYINTKDQVADIFTKGLFTSVQWSHLVFLSGIAESKVPRIYHEHVPLIEVDTVEKGTACNVCCIERAAEHAGETRVSQDHNPETGLQYFTIHDELDFDESGNERDHSYDESSIAGTVVTLPDGSTLSSTGGNQTSFGMDAHVPFS